MFKRKGNKVTSDKGFSVEVVGRTQIKYSEKAKTLTISAEMLAIPGFVIYSNSIQSWKDGESISDTKKQEIIDNLKEAFKFQNAILDVF